jgi:prepilin peptidase CpaA
MPAPELLCTAALAAFLLAACWTDVRARRIPNALVGTGMLAGLALQGFAPAGTGLFAYLWGGLGAGPALLGGVTGLALFMPLYLMRALGAGDVKLLAMVGVWVGAKAVLAAALWALVAGGVLALGAMLASRSSGQVLSNLRFMLTHSLLQAQVGKLGPLEGSVTSGVRMPYAIAIAVGSLAQVGWMLAAVRL